MFLNKLKSKLLDLFPIKTNSINISEAFGDLQNIASLYCYLIHKKDTVIICKSLKEAENLFNLAVNCFKIENVVFFPDFNIEPYTQSYANKVISKARIDALYALISIKAPKLLITTVLGSIFKTVGKEYLQSKQLVLTTAQQIKCSSIIDFIIDLGYCKKDKVIYQGECAIRGDILDIFPANSPPIRISFFNNCIESIKSFDVFSQRTIDNLNSININLPLEITLNKDTITNFNNNYRNILQYLSNDNTHYKEYDISNGVPLFAEHYLPLFYNQTFSVLSYLKDPTIIFNDTSSVDIQSIRQIYNDSYLSRTDKKNSAVTNNIFLPPEFLLLDQKEWEHNIGNNLNIMISSSKYPENTSYKQVISLESKDVKYLFNNTYNINLKGKSLIKLILDSKNSIFFINLINPNSIKYITNLLVENNINYVNLKSLIHFDDKHPSSARLFLLKEDFLTQGFMFENYIFICENDFFVNHTNYNNKHTIKKVNKKLFVVKELIPNELLVHFKHGVGRYIGLTTLNNCGIEHDFLELEYSGGDKLYIPVENIDLISKYGNINNEVFLDKLGGNSWQKRKSAIKEKLHELAYDLIKLAAVRNLQVGPQINPNPERYLEFINAFPHIETDDQLCAIEDIRNDFADEKITDRLICGDVGFGKTEVAMRAAFLAVASGYQVAIIAPTTLLVRQHYYNFLNRFEGFPFVIKQLSRFVSAKECKNIKVDLKLGKIDIIIATHALLSKDVEFNRLGLLIIDEEQNFGVVHKEKIKTLKENIHTINLTATPIPRTFQMALTGVKSLSIIATPPTNKLPIKTYVVPFEKVLIREAILREINRNGQIYIVAPFINELHSLQELLNNLDVDLKMLVLHGQMSPQIIENHMKDFQDNKFNVLLSTNIIESGIDLNNVNTIIITNADRFGLSQLYQLRGRVGRGNIQSYAYITYFNDHILTPNAKKRLEAIQNLDYLGAGFTLAEHDLDIRGAGNILGKEQSGHIKGIGIELYNKFLTEEINKLKLNNNTTVDYSSLSPNIVLPIVSLIPGKYINSMYARMEFYQKFANANSFAELEMVINELIDRFGKLPQETNNLVSLIKIKIMCKILGIEKLIAGTKALTIYFYNNKPLKIDELLLYVQQNPQLVKLQKDLSLTVYFTSTEKEDLIRETLSLLFHFKHIFGVGDPTI